MAESTFTGNVAYKYQMKMPPKTENTSGSVHRPMEEGRSVEGGVDEKMKAERKKRRK